jgi:hypothetical protein
MIVDVSDIVRDFSVTLATRIRSTGSYVSGIWTATQSEDPIFVCVQPVSGRTRASLPEGIRDRVRLAIWTTADLRTAVDGGAPADSVTIDGDATPYVVIEDRDRVAASHGRYRRVLLAVGRIPA